DWSTRSRPVADVTDVVQLAVGDLTACAVRANGAVLCWGQLWPYGGLYQPPDAPARGPAEIAGVTGVAEVAVSAATTCALRTAGTVSCWGLGFFGTCGGGPGTQCGRPAAVAHLTGVVQIVASELAFCARVGNGTVRCWGTDIGGLEASGPSISIDEPSAV